MQAHHGHGRRVGQHRGGHDHARAPPGAQPRQHRGAEDRPAPTATSSAPYPFAPIPMGPRATAGSNAQRPLANTMKRAERASTLLKAGALRTYRSPARMAWPIGSAPSSRWVAGRGQRYRTASTPRKDAEFSANAAAGPAAATSSPPIAGPTARATLALAPLSSAARG